VNHTRERILQASEELFRRQGFTGTGIKQILGVAEAPFGSLYHHFPGGKDELAAETIRRAGDHYAAIVTEKLTETDDVVANVRTAFRAAGQTLVDTGYADACPIETVALEVASTNEPLRLATAEVFESWIVGLTLLLQAEGIAEDRSRELGQVVLCALEGAFILARASRTTDALHACGDAMADLVAASLTAGTRARQPARRRPRSPR
jgi:AcrR family transcriptional regulator